MTPSSVMKLKLGNELNTILGVIKDLRVTKYGIFYSD
jgi:hypothetical protein